MRPDLLSYVSRLLVSSGFFLLSGGTETELAELLLSNGPLPTHEPDCGPRDQRQLKPCHDVTVALGVVKCSGCGVVSKRDDYHATSWDCACGCTYVFRRCSDCGIVSQVSSLQRSGQVWDCMWCHAPNSGFTTRKDPAQATLGDFDAAMSRHSLSFADKLADTVPMLVVTTNEIPGYRITQVHGDVFGLVVRARNAFSNLGAQLRTAVGGEVSGYTRLLTDSRNQARERMWQEARARGANAVVAMRFDCNEIGDIMSEVAAYGTAVTAEPMQPPFGTL